MKPVQRNRFVIPALSIASIIVLGLSAAGQDAGHDAAQSVKPGRERFLISAPVPVPRSGDRVWIR